MENTPKFRCALCAYDFPSVAALDQHKAQAHQHTEFMIAMHQLTAELEKWRELAVTVLDGCISGNSCGVCLPCLASRYAVSEARSVNWGQFKKKWCEVFGVELPLDPPKPDENKAVPAPAEPAKEGRVAGPSLVPCRPNLHVFRDPRSGGDAHVCSACGITRAEAAQLCGDRI